VGVGDENRGNEKLHSSCVERMYLCVRYIIFQKREIERSLSRTLVLQVLVLQVGRVRQTSAYMCVCVYVFICIRHISQWHCLYCLGPTFVFEVGRVRQTNAYVCVCVYIFTCARHMKQCGIVFAVLVFGAWNTHVRIDTLDNVSDAGVSTNKCCTWSRNRKMQGQWGVTVEEGRRELGKFVAMRLFFFT